MLILRWIVLAMLVAGLSYLGMYVATGQPRYRARGMRIIRWTVVAGLGFFAVLIIERLTENL